MMIPRSSPNSIVDAMTNYSEARIRRLVESWEEKSESRTKYKTILEEHELA